MLYLIEHDANGKPKTRWGTLGNDTEEIVKAVKTFCACLSYIDNIYMYDHKGNFLSLKEFCDTMSIPYHVKEE